MRHLQNAELNRTCQVKSLTSETGYLRVLECCHYPFTGGWEMEYCSDLINVTLHFCSSVVLLVRCLSMYSSRKARHATLLCWNITRNTIYRILEGLGLRRYWPVLTRDEAFDTSYTWSSLGLTPSERPPLYSMFGSQRKFKSTVHFFDSIVPLIIA